MCVGCGKGRVVKPRREPMKGQPIIGAKGISLLEYVGPSEKPIVFKVTVERLTTNYTFSNVMADRIRFVDKQHAEQLLSLKDDFGRPLFVEVATYGISAPVAPGNSTVTQHATRDEQNNLIPVDDLPDGFMQ